MIRRFMKTYLHKPIKILQLLSLHKKWSFPLRISSVNVKKKTVILKEGKLCLSELVTSFSETSHALKNFCLRVWFRATILSYVNSSQVLRVNSCHMFSLIEIWLHSIFFLSFIMHIFFFYSSITVTKQNMLCSQSYWKW